MYDPSFIQVSSFYKERIVAMCTPQLCILPESKKRFCGSMFCIIRFFSILSWHHAGGLPRMAVGGGRPQCGGTAHFRGVFDRLRTQAPSDGNVEGSAVSWTSWELDSDPGLCHASNLKRSFTKSTNYFDNCVASGTQREILENVRSRFSSDMIGAQLFQVSLTLLVQGNFPEFLINIHRMRGKKLQFIKAYS